MSNNKLIFGIIVFMTAIMLIPAISNQNAYATIVGFPVCSNLINGCEITTSPPNPVAKDPDNGILLVWNEVQNVALSADLRVDRVADTSASFIGQDPGGFFIKAGTIVSSHYVEWDNGSGSSNRVEAVMEFDSEIFAFITADQKLFDSDAELGLPGLDYNDFTSRGLEGGDITNFNGKFVGIDWFATSPGDWTRLITAFSPSAAPEPKKSNGGDEAWKTRPTSGLNYENGAQIVINGFGWNGNFLTVSNNHYQPFEKEILRIGERSTLTAKVYAPNGLASQSFGLGIRDVGSNDAEVELRANLNRDGSIDSIEVIQKTAVVNPETLTVSNEKAYCQEGDPEKSCDEIKFTFTLQEPLQYEKAYSQHIDFKRRAGQIWVNHGFEITGEQTTPMLSNMIPSNVRGEGLLKVTQVAKYSPYWVTDDHRIFEMNSFGSLKEINQSFERFQDTGTAYTRMHSGFGGFIAYEQNRALGIFDASTLVSELTESFTHIYPETGQRITEEMRQAMLVQEEIAKQVLDEMDRQDRHY